MEQRRLGKDGPLVSVIGFGAWPIGGGMGGVDRKTAVETVRASIDMGITLIDTAQMYRASESIIGEALKGGGWRDRCFLATKVSRDYSPAGVRAAMEDSLRALEVDYVDLYQVHSWRPQHPIEATMETMAQLQREGKTRYIGVSNFNAAQMQQAMQTAPFHANQPVYNLIDRQIEAEDLPFAAREGVGILAHSVLAKGLLTGKYPPGYIFPPDDERSTFPRFQGESLARYMALAEKLRAIASDIHLTMIELAVAWVLRLPTVTSALIGAKNPAQLEAYLGGVGVTLDDETLARIDAALASY
jgi:aryl-alcohol dehydrogenase-like predicted oxidoreductase